MAMFQEMTSAKNWPVHAAKSDHALAQAHSKTKNPSEFGLAENLLPQVNTEMEATAIGFFLSIVGGIFFITGIAL